MNPLFAALSSIVLVAPLSAQTLVTLEPDRDNTIFQNSAGCVPLTNGAGDRLIAGRTNSGQLRRGLISFDIAGSIPAGATILQVELDMRIVHIGVGSSQSHNFAMHRLTRDWGEGSTVAAGGQGIGGPAFPGDATWCDAQFGSTPWTTPGGDYVATPTTTPRVGPIQWQSYTFPSTQQFVADVQEFLDGTTPNYGWIIIGNESLNRSTRAFGSREHDNQINRPFLLVTYIENEPYWAGCDSPTAPQLIVDPSVGLCRSGIFGTFRLQFIPGSSQPIQSPTLFLGNSTFPGGLPLPAPLTCDVHVNPNLWVGPVDGAVGLTLNGPTDPAAQGVTLYWQGVGLAGGGIVTTNALVSHIRL